MVRKKCCDFLFIIVEWISGSLGQVTDTTAMAIDKSLDTYIP